MDLKLGNINHGELEVKNNDLVLMNDANMEIIQMIALITVLIGHIGKQEIKI